MTTGVLTVNTFPSLTALWHMDGNSNDPINSLNGTDTSVVYTGGRFGQSASYNGSTSKTTLAENTLLQPTGAFTVGAWFNKSVMTGGYEAILSVLRQDTVVTPIQSGYLFSITNGGKLSLISGKNSGGVQGTDWQECAGTITLTGDSLWHFGVGVYDGSNLKVYLDGKQDGTIAWANAPVYKATSSPRIGFGLNNSNLDAFWFQGNLDEIFLLNGTALTLQQIKNYYSWAIGRMTKTL